MLEVVKLDHNGRGISKYNGKIVFIENALPNEIVDITILKEKKNFIEAKVSKYIKKADNRIESLCPYYNFCGGCDILHLKYTDQLKFKENKIKDIVNKHLKDDIKINNILCCNNNLNYRNKATFQVNNCIGFFEKNSKKLIKIDNCIICNKKINNAIPYLNKLNLSNIKKITCRSSNREFMIIIDTTDNNLDISPLKEIATSIYLHINKNYKLVYGEELIVTNLEKYKFSISPDSFFQVNEEICIKLYNKIKSLVVNSKNILDLYCGTGSIGIFINENKSILGIEINENAIKNANKNKTDNNLKNIKFICNDSEKAIKKLDFIPDTIIVDPPRAGLSKNTINSILKINPKKIIYVSCDPMTLVRDLNIFTKFYNILEITPFDMFPNTKHVECVSVLYQKSVEKQNLL